MSIKRAPRYKRVPAAIGGFKLQERDFAIIRLAYEYRFLNSEQITALAPGSNQAILRRLQKLFHHGYLDRPISQIVFSNALFGHQKMVYGLGDKGADLLAKRLVIDDRGKIRWRERNQEVRERYLQHTLMISSLRACLTLALRSLSGIELLFWMRENAPELKDYIRFLENGRRRRLPVNPDGFFAIGRPKKKAHFFLEADRSTMTNSRFFSKMRAYWIWWKQGRAKEKFGIKDFRVLTLTKSSQRRDNLMQIAQQADDRQKGSAMFWFANEGDISLADPETILQPIWRTAVVRDHKTHSLFE